MIDTASGARLWSERFDWPAGRLYALQDRIAERVVMSLEGKALTCARRSRPGPGASQVTPEQLEREPVRALELDPGNQLLVNRHANRRWMFHGESAEAIAILEPAIASDPPESMGAALLASCMVASMPSCAAEAEDGQDIIITALRADERTIDVEPLDLQRIEVVSGLQSALCGHSSFAGLIKRRPKTAADRKAERIYRQIVDCQQRTSSLLADSARGPAGVDDIGFAHWKNCPYAGIWLNGTPLSGR